MCGGRGTRLDAPVEKPLLEIDGIPMIDRVIAALEPSQIDTVYPVTSPHTPATTAHLEPPLIETPGAGYVDDLGVALDDPRIDQPVLTVVADLPLLTTDHVNTAIDAANGDSVVVCVPVALKRRLGLTADTTRGHGGPDRAPTGLNVIGADPETTITSYDVRLAVNVNTQDDARIAEALA